MVKYKDTSEPRQAHHLKQIEKQELRQKEANHKKPFNKEKYLNAKK